jgi:hypothetical protein
LKLYDVPITVTSTTTTSSLDKFGI